MGQFMFTGKQNNNIHIIGKNDISQILNRYVVGDHIYSGYDCTICSDGNNKKIWAIEYDENNNNNKILIDYFSKHKINIMKICANVNGFCTYYISDIHRVYENKRNIHGKLGLHYNTNTYQPQLIKQLNGVIDIQSAYNYSLALCSMSCIDPILVRYICYDEYMIELIPNDIIHVICCFCKSNNQVFITSHTEKWEELRIFRNKNIIKIGAAQYHSLFLEDNGVLWYSNRFKYYSEPTPIKHFKTYNIRIKDIKCGESNNLAIDYKNKIYSWGHNTYDHDHQWGDSYRPKLIKSLRKYDIQYIDCGRGHSYCKTIDGKHILFGDNHWNQCITYDGREVISSKSPVCINQIIEQKYKGKQINSVHLGPHHTIIILKDMEKLQGNDIKPEK